MTPEQEQMLREKCEAVMVQEQTSRNEANRLRGELKRAQREREAAIKDTASGIEEIRGLWTLVHAREAERDNLRRLLSNSNDVLQSAYSIADRKGHVTNWIGFRERVYRQLLEQRDALYPKDAKPI